MKTDYRVYRLSRREQFTYLGVYLLLDMTVSYLFFYSWQAAVLFLPGVLLFFRDRENSLQKKRALTMRGQFLSGIQMVAASLQAGYSVENAFREALSELRKVYRAEDFIIRELEAITAQLEVNRSIEVLLLELGRRSGVEDIQSFAEVFLTAKRSGGDLLAIIRNTEACIRQKQETLQEIETCLSGKRMEQNIMSLVPVLLLAYVKLTSPEFLEVMYGNPTGTAVMGICFAVYAAAYFWGRSIVRIEV